MLTLHLELFYDRGNHYEFLTLAHQLASPGEIPAGGSGAAFDFDFKNVEKAHESYNGINVKLRYVTGKALSFKLIKAFSDTLFGFI